MLACVQRGGEMLAMQMLRRGDQDGVDALVVEQIAVVEVSLGVRRDLLGVFEALGIDVGEGHEIGVGAGHRLPHDLHAAVARTDNSQPEPFVGSQNIGNSECPGQAGSDFADEIAS